MKRNLSRKSKVHPSGWLVWPGHSWRQTLLFGTRHYSTESAMKNVALEPWYSSCERIIFISENTQCVTHEHREVISTSRTTDQPTNCSSPACTIRFLPAVSLDTPHRVVETIQPEDVSLNVSPMRCCPRDPEKAFFTIPIPPKRKPLGITIITVYIRRIEHRVGLLFNPLSGRVAVFAEQI
jgi:hypothetical protein